MRTNESPPPPPAIVPRAPVDVQRPVIYLSFLRVPVFFIVNLSSRKIPGLNVYAQMQNEKEQEMISPVSPMETAPTTQRELVTSLELLDTTLDTQAIGTVSFRDQSTPRAIAMTTTVSFRKLF